MEKFPRIVKFSFKETDSLNNSFCECYGVLSVMLRIHWVELPGTHLKIGW